MEQRTSLQRRSRYALSIEWLRHTRLSFLQNIQAAAFHPEWNHSMQLAIYVNYPGNCEEAFRFYEQELGGKLTGFVRHADMPNPATPADWKEKVLHARVEIGGTVLMGADVAQAKPMRSAYLTLSLNSEAEADRIYALLVDGGEIFMKMEKTPFANRFAMLRDRFGTSWMLLHQPESR
jgi:PhnB protein